MLWCICFTVFFLLVCLFGACVLLVFLLVCILTERLPCTSTVDTEPVCDTSGLVHAQLCNLLDQSKRLAYRGFCEVNIQYTCNALSSSIHVTTKFMTNLISFLVTH